MRPAQGHVRDDRGSATLEMAVLALPILLVLVLAVYSGRVGIAHAALDQAARDAARSASLATASTANSAGTAAANATLSSQGLTCTKLAVKVDTRGFATAPGQPAQVSAHVQCTLSLADLTAPGIPGTVLITADMSSPLDEYRTRK